MSDLRAEHSSDLPRGRRRNNKKKKSKPLNLGRDTSSHAHGLNARTRLPCFSWMDGWMDPRDRLLGGKWVAQTRLARVVVQAVGQWGGRWFLFSTCPLLLFLAIALCNEQAEQPPNLRALLWSPLAVTHKFETGQTRHEKRDTSNPPPMPRHQGGGGC